MSRKVSVIQDPSLGKQYEKRFVVVDSNTGEVLDNAQGYGYKTPQKAHAAWAYKNRDKRKDREKREKAARIAEWLRHNRKFEEMMETFFFEIECKHSWGPNDRFNTAFVREMLVENGFEENELGFSARELLNYWEKH